MYILRQFKKKNFLRLLSHQVNLETIKIIEMNSWRKIGQWVLIIIMTVKATCHIRVCSSLNKSLMNNTVEYHYNYHLLYFIQCAWTFYFISFNTKQSFYYIENTIVKRAHTCYYYPKWYFKRRSMTCHGQTVFGSRTD